MPKKAVIKVELFTEASEESTSTIKRQILAEAQIPWCAKIDTVEIYGK